MEMCFLCINVLSHWIYSKIIDRNTDPSSTRIIDPAILDI